MFQQLKDSCLQIQVGDEREGNITDTAKDVAERILYELDEKEEREVEELLIKTRRLENPDADLATASADFVVQPAVQHEDAFPLTQELELLLEDGSDQEVPAPQLPEPPLPVRPRTDRSQLDPRSTSKGRP